jgi:hypothetical protein
MYAATARPTRRAVFVTFGVLSLFLPAGCAEDLKTTPGSADAGGGDVAPLSSTRAGEIVTTDVDASWPDSWVLLDLESDAQVTDDKGPVWDLGFQRFKVKSNGGVSGTAGAEVAVLENSTLESVSAAPSMGWQVDAADGDDGNPDPDTVFNRGADTWFDYDMSTHALSAKPRVYVVRTASYGYFAVQMVRYYDDAGNPGFLRLRWKKVTAPTNKAPATPAMPATDGGATTGG